MSGISGSKRAVLAAFQKLAPETLRYKAWAARAYMAPSPQFVKQQVLIRNGLEDATWVETGTYRGETTHFLSKVARMVFSIEPEPALFSAAERRFKGLDKVRILHGTSEEIFPKLIPELK